MVRQGGGGYRLSGGSRADISSVSLRRARGGNVRAGREGWKREKRREERRFGTGSGRSMVARCLLDVKGIIRPDESA